MQTNTQLAALFNDIAGREDILGENAFKIRAYRNVAEIIDNFPRPIRDVWQAGELDSVPGIGKEIAKKIDELMRTGKLDYFERLRAKVPDGVAALLDVPDLGPKRVKLIWETLGVTSLDALEAAAQAGKLRDLPKMGEKTEQRILAGIASLRRRATGRVRLGDALPVARAIVDALRDIPGVAKIEYAGSLRRGRETIGDVDIVVASTEPAAVMTAFRALPLVAEVLGAGPTKSSIRTTDNLQVDLRAVDPRHWGATLQYFTGSQAHNIRVRAIAQQLGYSLNEYGITPPEGELIPFATEEALYARLGLAWIPPELREDRGEIEAAALGANRLPKLVTAKDLRGDLQMHSTWSDGAANVMGMAQAALELGYEYILITDHSRSLAIANGLTPERLIAQRKEIEQVNRDLGGRFRVLQGVECEVLSDGALDLPDEALAACDLVQASVHTSLSQARERITARALRAIANPNVHILGHPSGRQINAREPADYDWEALFAAAATARVALEINANPERLDLNDTHARRAAELGCMLTISTDAHSPAMLRNMEFGLLTARRAWITPERVVNTWPLEKVLDWARERRAQN
jgi:DNA polymerase (family 10)